MLRNFWWRWGRCTGEMTFPVAMPGVANRLVVPLRT